MTETLCHHGFPHHRKRWTDPETRRRSFVHGPSARAFRESSSVCAALLLAGLFRATMRFSCCRPTSFIPLGDRPLNLWPSDPWEDGPESVFLRAQSMRVSRAFRWARGSGRERHFHLRDSLHLERQILISLCLGTPIVLQRIGAERNHRLESTREDTSQPNISWSGRQSGGQTCTGQRRLITGRTSCFLACLPSRSLLPQYL